jgi:hypothetical protein
MSDDDPGAVFTIKWNDGVVLLELEVDDSQVAAIPMDPDDAIALGEELMKYGKKAKLGGAN